MIESTEQAIGILQNSDLGEQEKEEAVDFLQKNPSAESYDALVAGLDDDDYGVGWACGSALAQLGEPAFPPLLKALSQPGNSIRLRRGARHVIHYNTSIKVRNQSADLLKALKGQGAASSTEVEAHRLLTHFG